MVVAAMMVAVLMPVLMVMVMPVLMVMVMPVLMVMVALMAVAMLAVMSFTFAAFIQQARILHHLPSRARFGRVLFSIRFRRFPDLPEAAFHMPRNGARRAAS